MERFIEWLTRRLSRPSSRRSFLDRTAATFAALAASFVGLADANAKVKKKKKPPIIKKKRRAQCCEYDCDTGPRGGTTVTICRHGSCPDTLDRIARCETCWYSSSSPAQNCHECGNSIVSACAGKTIKKKPAAKKKA